MCKNWEENGSENSDDSDNYEKFNKGKSLISDFHNSLRYGFTSATLSSE
jgi:hypothetical protein